MPIDFGSFGALVASVTGPERPPAKGPVAERPPAKRPVARLDKIRGFSRKEPVARLNKVRERAKKAVTKASHLAHAVHNRFAARTTADEVGVQRASKKGRPRMLTRRVLQIAFAGGGDTGVIASARATSRMTSGPGEKISHGAQQDAAEACAIVILMREEQQLDDACERLKCRGSTFDGAALHLESCPDHSYMLLFHSLCVVMRAWICSGLSQHRGGEVVVVEVVVVVIVAVALVVVLVCAGGTRPGTCWQYTRERVHRLVSLRGDSGCRRPTRSGSTSEPSMPW